MYQSMFEDTEENIKLEYELWVAKWQAVELEYRPSTAIEALQACGSFPNMAILLERLESLLMLQIHREYTPTIDGIIDRFAETSARRLKLAF